MEAVMPRAAGVRWGPDVAASLVGQTPTVNGEPSRVIAAWLDGDGELHVRLEVESDLLDGVLRGISL
jgi:hypothetical protein